VKPDDAARIAAFHRALSLETVHFRYFSALCELPPLILRRFSQVDFARNMVLVAELGERLIALASWHRGALPDSAEVAFVVADEHQGRGLGTLLLERLAELARERGLTRFRADTLAGNRAMLRVFADAGFALERESNDSAVVHLRFPVAETTAARSARELREHLAEARSVARLLAPRTILLAGDCGGDAARLRAGGCASELCTDAERAPHGLDLVLWSGAAAGLAPLMAAVAAAGARPRARCDRRRAGGRAARAVRPRAAPGGAAQRHASGRTRLVRSYQHRALRAAVQRAARRAAEAGSHRPGL
jgi:GNAT superfamily N-acetyltransferase